MNGSMLKRCAVSLIALFFLLTVLSVFSVSFSARAESGAGEGEEIVAERYAATDSLRKDAAANGWSVAVFADGNLTSVPAAEEKEYTYYTMQVSSGYQYSYNDGAYAFVPDEISYTAAADWSGDDSYLEKEYSFVLRNDADNDMALVYTADRDGTLYYQDLAQVAPLHFDDRDKAGVYGEYRIYKISAAGETAQLYPAETTAAHELYAANAAPVTSAWVNSSVEVAAGDRLAFVSEKADSTVFSSPVVSYEAFPETYELKNFWKWQQVADANYFRPVYRTTEESAWMNLSELETRGSEDDIYQRGGVSMRGVKFWSQDYQYIGAFGGMWIHASGNSDGTGDIAYAFKVPRDGFVDISLAVAGEWRVPGVEIWYDGQCLASTADGDTIFKKGVTLSAETIKVTKDSDIYFVQKTTGGGSLKQDLNPMVTYVEAPYQIDKTALTIDEGESDTLSVALAPAYGLQGEDIRWAVAGGQEIVRLSAETGESVTVTGLKGGQTVITAQTDGYDPVSCEVTVNAVLKNEFSLSAETLSVEKGNTGSFTVTIADSGVITADDLEVMSDDETVATATIAGTEVTVIAHKAGTAKIYVIADGSKSDFVTVTVTDSDPEPIPPEVLPSEPENPGSRTGLWIGIGCGAAVFVAGVTAAAVLLVRHKKKSKNGSGSDNNGTDQ